MGGRSTRFQKSAPVEIDSALQKGVSAWHGSRSAVAPAKEKRRDLPRPAAATKRNREWTPIDANGGSGWGARSYSRSLASIGGFGNALASEKPAQQRQHHADD